MRASLGVLFKTLAVILGIAVFLNGTFIWMTSNFNLGNLLVFALSALLLTIGIFGEKLYRRLPKWLSVCLSVILVFSLLLCTFLMIYGTDDTVKYTEDAVIVLGAGIRGDRPTLVLKKRLDMAALYHERNPDALIIVSGGQGMQEIISEAEAMEKYLLEIGVDASVIVKEQMSASTFENFTFSKKILDERFPDGFSVAFVTNEFHVFRAKGIAENTGFDGITHLHSTTEWYSVLPCVLRECLAVMKFWVFGN